MADVKDLRNLPLHELIGGPLLAIVEAEAQAARATVDFIERVGFQPADRAGAGVGGDGQLGPMRMAEFEYIKADETGVLRPFRVRVPLLALTPIPAVRVKTARIKFTAKVTDAEQEAPRTNDNRSLFSRGLLRLRGGIAPKRSPNESDATRSMEIDIDIELETAPIPPGLEKILNALDVAIRDEKK
jgi:hypothetical protein